MDTFYCRGCGRKIQETALACPECGTPQQASITEPSAGAPAASVSGSDAAVNPAAAAVAAGSFMQKLHIALIASAGLGTVLIFTTLAFALIGACAGVAVVASIRLFLAHKKNAFHGSSQLNWTLVLGGSILALLCMLGTFYYAMGLILIFVGVRSLLMYFSIYSKPATAAP